MINRLFSDKMISLYSRVTSTFCLKTLHNIPKIYRYSGQNIDKRTSSSGQRILRRTDICDKLTFLGGGKGQGNSLVCRGHRDSSCVNNYIHWWLLLVSFIYLSIFSKYILVVL